MKAVTIQYSDDMAYVNITYQNGDSEARGSGRTVREAVKDAFTSPPVRDEETDEVDEEATAKWREWECQHHNLCLNLIAFSAM